MVWQVPSTKQQAPAVAGGVKTTVSTGLRDAFVFVREPKRFAVWLAPSAPITSHPKFVAELSSHACTSATKAGVDGQV
jgi:hypothetical protein